MAGLVLLLLCALAVLVVAVLRGADAVPAASPAATTTSHGRALRGGTAADGPDGASPHARARPTPDAHAIAAATLLADLGERLRHGTRRQVLALGAPGDRRVARELTTLRRNVRALGVTDLSLRYVGGDPARGKVWVGQVQLRWRLRGFDTHDSLMRVPVTFRDTDGRATFVTARRAARPGAPAGERSATPLWLLAPVSVVRTPRVLVVTADAGLDRRFIRLADRAVVDVHKVLTRWTGRLVVEVPGGREGLTRVLGSRPGAYAGIAAVTTTADGSARRAAPVHVFVNERVFGPLGPRGSQIVMSHEATHVATGAALSTLPPWLLEGFADYVALDHVDLPVSVTASQVIGRVRRVGVPSHLPGPAEFDSRDSALGAAYESAWLACRLLGETYGERRLIAFYRAADRASSTASAFRTVLGTDQRAFTRAWRADLRRLAG